MVGFHKGLSGAMAAVLAVLSWLALPVAALLFLQWPLREVIHLWSREANDLGQWLFALFIAGSVAAATRADAHLATDAIAQRWSAQIRRRLSVAATLLALMPWAAFTLWSAMPVVARSVVGLERFPDTGNPGYFLVKLALALLLVLILAQAVLDLLTPRRSS